MFAQRRQKFREAMGPDAVALFIGGRMVTRSNDTEFPFRQDSDFGYLTGFHHPEAIAVLRTDDGPAFTLFVQPHEPEAETWTGYRPGVEGARSDYAADSSYPISEFPKELPNLVQKARRIYHMLGRNTGIDAQLVEILEDMRRRSRQGMIPASEIIDPRAILHEMRLFKEPEEVDFMRRAAEITAVAHREAAQLAHEGRHEYELEAVLNYTFRRLGADGPAYTTIVGGGANAATLHYTTNDQPLRNGDLVLIDAGAEYKGYAADVTRTYPVGGHMEGPQRDVYEVVLAAQEAGLVLSKPGSTLDAIHQAALSRLVEGLVALGLLSGSVDDLIEGGEYRRYYMHRTSHWLGLDVHDVGNYVHEDRPRSLEPGMAFTVEPGLYIADSIQDEAASRFRGIGVRIEDDVIITESGHENLNSAIPKRPEEVEAWVGGD